MEKLFNAIKDILKNTSVTIDKNGVGIHNDKLDVNIPISNKHKTSSGIPRRNVERISSNDRKKDSQGNVVGVTLNGFDNLYGGIHITALITTHPSFEKWITEFYKFIECCDKFVTVDSMGNLITFLTFKDTSVVNINIPAEAYNSTIEYFEDNDLYDSIVDYVIDSRIVDDTLYSIEPYLTGYDYPMDITDTLQSAIQSLNENKDTIMYINDSFYYTGLMMSSSYFIDSERVDIGVGISEEELATCIPEVPEDNDIDFLRKHKVFFGKEENLIKSVKLDILNKLL